VPLTTEPSVLAGRLVNRGIEARLITPAYLDYLYTGDRFVEVADLLSTARAPANSDTRPICYQYTLLLWLSKFFPVLAWLDIPEVSAFEVARSPLAWLAILTGAGLLLACRRWPGCRRAVLVAAAGFMGMVLETAVILAYQVRSGILYQDLGLLLTIFMAGLAIGSLIIDRVARGIPGRGRRQRDPESRGWYGVPRTTGVLVLGGFVVLSLLMGRYLSVAAGNLILAALLLAATGFLVAAIFAYASLHRLPDQRLVISPLYAADLLGGCLGSVVASLLLIPVLGMGASCLLMALLAAGIGLLI
jgi:spermidine synthase